MASKQSLPPKSIVSIARNPNEEQAVREAIKNLGGVDKFVKKGAKVLIKPNLALPKPPEFKPETTSPGVTAALVKLCIESGAEKVYVGDQSAWGARTSDTVRVSGIKDAVEKEGGEILYFEDEPRIPIKTSSRIRRTLYIPKILKEVDVVINAPKMKTSIMGLVSLGMKNFFGCISFKDRLMFHRGVDTAYLLAELANAIRPALTVIDAIVAMEGRGAHDGLHKRLDLVIASPDMVAADAVATAIMGIDPLEPPVNQVASWMGLGTADLSRIEIRGEKIEDVRSPFERAPIKYVSPHPNVEVYPGGICPGCAPRVSAIPNPDPAKKYAVIIGRRAMVPKELNVDEVWCVGLCGIESAMPLRSSKSPNKPKFKMVSGCPPIRWYAMQTNLSKLSEKGWAKDFSTG